MDFYDAIRTCLAWVASVACLWPINLPWLVFAFRINEGAVEEDRKMDGDELWKRSALASFFLALLTAGFIVLDSLLAQWLDFPAQMIHPIIFLGYPPAAIWLLTYYFSYDDAVQATYLFAIYLAFPILLLAGLNWMLGIWKPVLQFIYPWLKDFNAL